MKTRIAVMIVLLLFTPLALAQDSSRPSVAISTQVITPTASTALTVPSATRWAQITVRTAGVHVAWDDTAATTSDHYYPANTVMTVEGNALLADMRFIDSSDGTSTVYITYFDGR